MKEKATVKDNKSGKTMVVIYDFVTNILDNLTTGYKITVPTEEYKRMKDASIKAAKEKDRTLTFNII